MSIAVASQDNDDKLKFRFESIALEELFDFVQRNAGYTIVSEPNVDIKKKVRAYSELGIPKSAVVDFLRIVLSPDLTCEEYEKKILHVLKISDAVKKTVRVFIGNDPDKVPITKELRVQIVPIQYMTIKDVLDCLGSKFMEGLEKTVEVSKNYLILRGKAEDIHRFLKILILIDVPLLQRFCVEIIHVKNANVNDLVKTLKETFKVSSSKPAVLTADSIHIIPDDKTNSIIIVSTKENIEIVKGLVLTLDNMSKILGLNIMLYPLRYADAVDVADVINKMFQSEKTPIQPMPNPSVPKNTPSQDGSSTQVKSIATVKTLVYSRTNTLIVMASDLSQRIIAKLVEDMDAKVQEALVFKVFPIKYGLAKDIVKQIEQLFSSRSSSSSTVKKLTVIADERTNTVITTAPNYIMDKIDQLVYSLDIKSSKEIAIFKIKNADINKITSLINTLLKGSKDKPTTPTPRPTTPTPTPRPPTPTPTPNPNPYPYPTPNPSPYPYPTPNPSPYPYPTPNPSPYPYSIPNPNPTPSPTPNRLGPLSDTNQVSQDGQQDTPGTDGRIEIIPDLDSGHLIVKGTKDDIDAIKSLLAGIDKFRPQVHIKVLILEVSVDEQTQFGLQGFWENQLHLNKDLAKMRISTNFSNVFLNGFSYLLTADELDASLKALASQSRLSVLASPRILALNNQQSEIFVGQRVPIITNITFTYWGPHPVTQYIDVGLKLVVTPTINPDGLVTLQIVTNIADVAQLQGVTIAPNVTLPIFNDTKAQTTASIQSGQSVVLGGLVRSVDNVGKEKVPILGDIPVLSSLFSTDKKIKQKRELVIFLTPYITYNPAETEQITELEKSKLELIDATIIESEAPIWRSKIKD